MRRSSSPKIGNNSRSKKSPKRPVEDKDDDDDDEKKALALALPDDLRPGVWPTLAENGNPEHQDLQYGFVGLRGFQNPDGTLNINGIQLPDNPIDCASPYYFLDFDAKKMLGSGSFGQTYAACLAGGACDFVGKVVPLDSRLDTLPNARAGILFNDRNFMLETLIGTFLGTKNVGPKIYAAFRCRLNGQKVGVIIMEKLGKPLYKTQLTLQSWKNLWTKIQGLHKEGILHGDLYTRNIMTTFETQDEKDHEFRIIDYGTALILRDPYVGQILKTAEVLDFFFGEARLVYGYAPDFQSKKIRAEAWLDVIRDVPFSDFQEAAELVTFGLPDDPTPLYEDTYDDFGLILQKLKEGAQDYKSGLPKRGEFYQQAFQLTLPAQVELQYMNKYAIQMGATTSRSAILNRPFVPVNQRTQLASYLSKKFSIPMPYLEKYFQIK